MADEAVERIDKMLLQLRQSEVEIKQLQEVLKQLLEESRATTAEIDALANTSKDRPSSRFDPIEAALKRHDQLITGILEILTRLI
jgi:conjugal transfer/entry exclusion protein